MKAEQTTRSDNQRQQLCDILPLEAPLSVYVQCSNVCNFKCSYCSQMLDNNSLKALKISRQLMSYETFCKISEQLRAFNGKIKTINLTGFGEPLINKELPKMVALCKQQGLSDRTEVVTNGSLLTHELSDKLISAGLDLLRISIQGLTSKKYEEVSKIKIDMAGLVEQISYFYSRKQNTRLYIKILDAALDSNETADDFFRMFGDICNNIAVEHLVPVMPGVDYSGMGKFDTGMVGYKNEGMEVCPRPFYMMTIDTDGSVRPCCNYNPPLILGNINESTLRDLWEGNKMKAFRLLQLEKTRIGNAVCRTCQTPVYGLHAEDNLDLKREKLKLEY